MLVTGALAVAGVGLAMLLLGIPLAVAGASRARAAGHRAPGTVSGTDGSWTPATKGAVFAVGAGVVVLALMVALGGFGSTGGGTLGPAGASGDDGAGPYVFEGRLSGGNAPVVGDMGAGAERAEHVVTPAAASGVVEAVLAWDDGTTAPELVVIVEAQGASGEWREITRAEGGSELMTRSGPEPLPGDVRVVVRFAEGSGGDVPYRLAVNVSPP